MELSIVSDEFLFLLQLIAEGYAVEAYWRTKDWVWQCKKEARWRGTRATRSMKSTGRSRREWAGRSSRPSR